MTSSLTRPFLPLFDPATRESPPRTAIELYFETPVTLGLFYTLSVESGRTEYADAAVAAWEAGIGAALVALERETLLKVGEHYAWPGHPSIGMYLPGQLFVTRVGHTHTELTDIARFHDHVYIGAEGICDDDGKTWPVDISGVRRSLTSLAAQAAGTLEQSLRASIGVEWGLEKTHLGFRELVGPALAQYVPDYPRSYCRDSRGLSRDRRWNVVDLVQRL